MFCNSISYTGLNLTLEIKVTILGLQSFVTLMDELIMECIKG